MRCLFLSNLRVSVSLLLDNGSEFLCFWDWSGLCYLRRRDEMLHHLWQTAIRGNCPFAAKLAIHQIYEASIKNVFLIGNSSFLTGQ